MSKQSSSATNTFANNQSIICLAKKFARLNSREHRDRLACGAIANRLLKRYSRKLNAKKLAEFLTEINGKPTSRESVNDYLAAYRMHRIWREKSGGAPPQLEISKLALAFRAGPAHLSDTDKVTLCERAVTDGLTRSQMTGEALRISKEKSRSQLKYEIKVRDRNVRQMDGLDLLKELSTESVDVLILDWMYKPFFHRADNPLPQLHSPEKPEEHIIHCLVEARRVITPHGVVAFFVDHRSDPSIEILSAFRNNGLRRVDQYVAQRVVGNFTQAVGSIYSNSHEIIDIYRRTDVDDFPRHLVNIRTVSPRWHCRNHRASSETAVHPCEKPLELMLDLIRPVTVNGLVVDPFCGSGSSGVAAVQLGCNFVGAELVPEYVEIANRRIALAVDREAGTLNAINAALAEASPREQAAIENHLNEAGIELVPRKESA